MAYSVQGQPQAWKQSRQTLWGALYLGDIENMREVHRTVKK